MKYTLALFMAVLLATNVSAIKPGEILLTVDGLINATYPCVKTENSIYIAYDAPVGNSSCLIYYQRWVDDTTTTTLPNNGGGGSSGGHRDTGPPDWIHIWNPGMARNITTPYTIPNPPKKDGQIPVVAELPILVSIPTVVQEKIQYVDKPYEIVKTDRVEIPIKTESPANFWLIVLAGICFIAFLVIGAIFLWQHKQHMELQDNYDTVVDAIQQQQRK